MLFRSISICAGIFFPVVKTENDDIILVFLNKRKVLDMQQDDERLMNIEMTLANHEKMLDELNQVTIEQSKVIEKLIRQNQYLLNLAESDTVKPQSEETPPPHY